MTVQEQSYWDPTKRQAYLDGVAQSATASKRQSDGRDLAEGLGRIWKGLSKGQQAIFEAMVLTDRRSLVAFHDHRDLRDLVAKGLLAYPRGHGGNWMRAAKTTYSIPVAIWQQLREMVVEKPDGPASNAGERLQSATALLSRLTDD